MKKLLTSVLISLTIASFGGILATAYAQTTNADQSAADQQTLSALQAQLQALEMQQAAQAVGLSSGAGTAAVAPAMTPSTLSAEDAASLKQGLALLAQALTSLQMEFANNPHLASTHEQAVVATLQGIGQTLSLMMATVGGGTTGANIASAAPSPATVSGSGVVQTPTPAPIAVQPEPANAGVTIAANETPSAATPAQTAQASVWWSPGNINWPLVIVIALILLAVGLWLFWPTDDEEIKKPARKSPAQPPMVVAMPKPTVSASGPSQTSTPMAAAVAAPQSQQRKPA